ncbi:necrosis inducing protein [Colletotrichum scovillei]|uniref:necrosis inducing protein n=1 Tax=Colletotrichum scovillei TaxID=1209932 RepID=UPI0015C3B858|nr:necrosis inducing protein [Colletotrichum scovillei]KAF4774989.1 necrosis inducing protein [Colletotrichum scovillei]
MTFKPLIHSWHGCVPYAAVDVDGAAGAGLKPTGKAGGDCRDLGQSGQTYTRIGKSHGRTGIIYSYYLPKVQGNDEQHKHHWITAVVWLAVDKCPDDIANFSPRGVAYSTKPQGAFDTTHATNTLFVIPLIPSANSPEGALSPPLVAWDRLPAAAKEQLNSIRYKHTRVPFSDANFQSTLDSTYSDTFFTGSGPDSTDYGDNTPSQDEINPNFGNPITSSTAAPEPKATGP